MGRPRLESGGGKTVLRSECCSLPHGEVVGGKLRVTSRHEKERHAVDLTPADLRALADHLERGGSVTWAVER